MYGKHFSSMYSGSMVGSGSHVFAVMGYVIANMKPDAKVGAQVELNPKLLGFIIGEPEDRILEAIEFLCAPDKQSRTKDEGGRRLVRLSQFDYRVVNGAKYCKIRDEEGRREYNRVAKQRSRANGMKQMVSGKPDGESAFCRTLEAGGSDAQLDAIVTDSLPSQLQ